MNDQKINWVTYLKVIGILAVILGHIASPLSTFIFSWHMPLFFIVSGFFMDLDVSFEVFFIKNFKRLMVPYFIFSMVGLLVEILKRYVLHREALNLWDELQGIFIGMDMASLVHTYAFVLWFLPTLFFARVMLYTINRYITNLWLRCIVISLIFKTSFYINVPFALDNAFNALLFVFIGNLYFRLYQDEKILYFLPILLLGIYVIVGFPLLDMATKHYSSVFLNILWAVSLIYTMIITLKQFHLSTQLLTLWGATQ
ncbi:MAG: acyltransferase family protein [Sulfurospirillaceae bacterium]|nr:acyltransferase family protein [Sulfurospirillaceae bacterium]